MTTLGRTIPALPTADIEAAVDFYRTRLGFDLIHHDDVFAILQRDLAEIHLWGASDTAWMKTLDPLAPVSSGAESFLAGTASCRIEVEGIDDLFIEFGDSGVLHPSTTEVRTTKWSTKEISVLDMDGNLLTFFEFV
jgi:catechol 2,3-dioxygenase-like lactoylglutathione lyase family enzyme